MYQYIPVHPGITVSVLVNEECEIIEICQMTCLLAWYICSNCLAELGQQVICPWGDIKWVGKISESVTTINMANLVMVSKCMKENKKRIKLCRVQPTCQSNMENMELAKIMEDDSVEEFGEKLGFIEEYSPG